MDTGEANSHALSSASQLTSRKMENSSDNLSGGSNSDSQSSQPFLDITNTNTTVPDHSGNFGGSDPTDTSLHSTPIPRPMSIPRRSPQCPRDMENIHLPEAQLQDMAEAACTNTNTTVPDHSGNSGSLACLQGDTSLQPVRKAPSSGPVSAHTHKMSTQHKMST